MTGRLTGRSVLVTRPAELSAPLIKLLDREGCKGISLPAIDILPADDHESLAHLIARLDLFDLAVFVSPTAVARANEAVRAIRRWPAGLRCAAIGSGTARALKAAGFHDVIAPVKGGDSEALAALPELADVSGSRVVIFRGQGGRESLRQTLEGRGASVEYAECYRRAAPTASAAPLLAYWEASGIDAVCVTSVQGLENLLAMLGQSGAARVIATPLFVPHPRIAEAASRLGVRQVVVTGAGDELLVEALVRFFAKV